jgi:hypothetical protein
VEEKMKTWMKVLVVTLLTGLPTIPLGRVIWPDPVSADGMAMASAPTGVQLPLLIALSLFEGLAFGLGISFLAFGLPTVRRATAGNKPLMWATFVSIAWWLVSWWPHDNLHRVASDLSGLIAIEYAFHVTLIVAACCVAFTFLRLLGRVQVTQAATLPSGVDMHAQPSASR